ncbi:helix-turn-helix domain-containing protein [Clostridium gasigenes]|uniref:HTH cro/C1-type domain-containing protein n=1 Tax=Clostridium gasigenes TaxID=94869 RepID=A0A1H0N2Z9_9CLOT|nr:helix-turn-helix transcriptional regulator [Clostridium gasigenes]SDO86750.1 hypothetical protein SAMN04488529_101656 [Clostridium gasigenes]
MININTNILKSERVKIGFTQKKVANILKKDISTYSKKENGIIEFTASEINILKNLFCLSPEKIDEIFFNEKVAFNETISIA